MCSIEIEVGIPTTLVRSSAKKGAECDALKGRGASRSVQDDSFLHWIE